MSNFAVGARVRVTNDRFGSGGSDGEFFTLGDIGVVVLCDDMSHGHVVDFKNQGNARVFGDGIWGVNDSALELVQ
jgi:hypothetical protein